MTEEVRNIKITQIASWLANATTTKKFLLKPNDLRMLYLLVLWDYISKRNADAQITQDHQITIPEPDLVRMVRLVFHECHYPLFCNINSM